MAGSLLHGAGLHELVTSNLEEYEAPALKLSRDPDLLVKLRARLERNLSTVPLFNAARSCRHLESAYSTMCESRLRRGAPRSFRVEPVE